MKLRKLLPLATFATVAGGMTLSSLAACSCGPEIKEYDIKIIEDPNKKVIVDKAKFMLNQPLVITYTIDASENWKLDKASSEVTVGETKYTVDTLLSDDENYAIILSAEQVTSPTIKVGLVSYDTHAKVEMTWPVHDDSGEIIDPDEGWTDLPEKASSDKHFQDIATYEYLTDVSDKKEILAGDLAYSYYKDYLNHQDERDYPYYAEIKTTVGYIDVDDSRFNFTIECTPYPTEGRYMKLDVKDMQFILIYCHQGTSSEWYYTLDPLVYWLMPSTSKTAALNYLKNDHKWQVSYQTTEEGSDLQVVDSTSDDTTLTSFLTNIQTNLSLSFWTHYCEDMTPPRS